MLVGIAIGTLCVLIILQVLSSWEKRKRTTSSGNDAQIIGTLGAFLLDRDLRLAGYGFGTASSDVMGCPVKAYNAKLPVPNFNFNLRPVEILKGTTDDKPDTITVLYGNSPYFVASEPMTGAAAESNTLKTRDGFQIGDKILVTGNTPVDCQLVEMTSQSTADTVTILHEANVPYTTLAGVTATASMNPSGGTGTTFTTGAVFDLGPTPVQSVWTVDSSRNVLTRYNQLFEPKTAAVDLASDVVNFKAQYGIDIDGDGKISSTEWFDTTTAATNWTQVLAVRFALLMRSRQFERPDATNPVAVTPIAPTWGDGTAFVLNNVDGTTDAGASASAIGGAAAANNWRNYRYRVYENVVPLRNMIWGTAP